jgi:hypothetical protein
MCFVRILHAWDEVDRVSYIQLLQIQLGVVNTVTLELCLTQSSSQFLCKSGCCLSTRVGKSACGFAVGVTRQHSQNMVGILARTLTSLPRAFRVQFEKR